MAILPSDFGHDSAPVFLPLQYGSYDTLDYSTPSAEATASTIISRFWNHLTSTSTSIPTPTPTLTISSIISMHVYCVDLTLSFFLIFLASTLLHIRIFYSYNTTEKSASGSHRSPSKCALILGRPTCGCPRSSVAFSTLVAVRIHLLRI